MSRRNKKAVPKNTIPPVKQRFIFGFRSFIDVAAGVITLVLAIPVVIEYFKTPNEKFNEEKFIEGDLKPATVELADINGYYEEDFLSIGAKISNAKLYKKVIGPEIKGIFIPDLKRSSTVYIGTEGIYSGFSIPELEKGVDIFSRLVGGCMPLTSKLLLGIKNGRIYVSTEFKDIQNEQTIGVLHYNHWKLYKDNTFDFNNNDTELEVIDKQSNIVFAIKYIGGNKVQLSGYFISPSSVFIIRNILGEIPRCVLKNDPNWKSKAEILIAGIVSATQIKTQN